MPVCDPLDEAVQHVSFALFFGVEMPRHGHEVAEEVVQGLAGLLLQECEPVSDGRQRFVWDKNSSEGCHHDFVVGGWGGGVQGKALVNLLKKGEDK